MDATERDVVVDYAGSRLKAKVTERGAYKCPLCDAIFFSKRDLVAHIISHALGLPAHRKHAPHKY